MFPNLAPGEMMVVLILAVVLFGKKLPEVGRSLGKGIVEFKKGLRGIEDEFDISSSTSASTSSSSSRSELSRVTDEDGMISVPKFEPPTSAPYIQPSPIEGGPKLS
jgi:sec-independent protein translocase protein TatA